MSPNGCFMRVGTATQPMPTSMIDDLYARRIHTTLRNIPSPRQDLTFAQLKIYYQERGLALNDRFASSLELLTPDGKLNYVAYLLADENGVSIKVAKYAGTDKVKSAFLRRCPPPFLRLLSASFPSAERLQPWPFPWQPSCFPAHGWL